MNKKKLIIAGAVMAVSQLLYSQDASKVKGNDPAGKCWGIVGAGEGDCGGKDPKTGASWSCSGQNPSADLGWKKTSKSECDATPKHKSAKEKKFVANK